MFDVNEFKSVIGNKGVTPANKFRAVFNIPPGLNIEAESGPRGETVRTLEYWCESVTIPDFSLRTHQVPRYSYGPMEFRPYTATFQPTTFTFINDGHGNIWNFFTEWLNMVFNVDMSNSINGPSTMYNPSSATGGFFTASVVGDPYEVAYKDEYVTDVNINVFNPTGAIVNNIMLREAFPVAMNVPTFSWQDNNSYSRINVMFAFTDWFRLPLSDQPLLDNFF